MMIRFKTARIFVVMLLVISFLSATAFSAGAYDRSVIKDSGSVDENAALQAIEDIREGMANRKTTITGTVVLDQVEVDDTATYIYNHLYDYCDDPRFGDYLRLSVIKSSMSYSASGIPGRINFQYILTPTYYTSTDQEKQVDEFAENFALQLDGLTEYQKIKRIYSYITENIEYDYEYNTENGLGDIGYTAYSALFNKKAVCQGISALFYRLAMQAGVSCRVITGYAGGPHAWNIAKIKDRYYCIDASWAITTSDFDRYFLKGSPSFEDHFADDRFTTEEFNNEFPVSTVDYYDDDSANLVSFGQVSEDIIYEIYLNSGSEDLQTYTLFIKGSGRMPDYTSGAVKPWDSYIDSITAAVVSDGITYAGDYTFAEMKSLKSVAVEDTVREIGDYFAFESPCLEQVYFPSDAIKGRFDIGGRYGDNVYWELLTDSGRMIISGAGKMGEPLKDRMYSSDYVPWIKFRKDIKELVVEEGVTTVSRYAFFYNINMKSITFPSTMSELETQAFRSCASLTQIEFPSGMTSIWNRVFENCENLKSFIIPSSVTYIGDKAIGYKYDGTKIDGIIIYGVRGSAAETYAEENDITFVEYSPESVLLIDKQTGVSVKTDAAGDKLAVRNLTDDENERVYTLLPKAAEAAASYIISLTDSSGISQNTSEVEIRIPVPEGYDGKYCRAAKISDNGFEYIDFELVDGEIVINTVLDGSVISVIYKGEYIKGDADSNGKVNISDVTLLQKYLSGQVDYRNIDLEAAGVSGKVISVVDVSILQQYIAKIITSL